MNKYIIRIPNGPQYEFSQKELEKFHASGQIPANARGRRSDSSEFIPVADLLAWSASHSGTQAASASVGPAPAGTASGGAETGEQSVVDRLRLIAGVIKIAWAVAGLVVGGCLGAAIAGRDLVPIPTALGALLGVVVGYLIGTVMAVWVDWAAEMLLLQAKTHRAVIAIAQRDQPATPKGTTAS